MRLTIVLLIAACLQAQANGYGQSVSISVQNASLENVLKKIKKQARYHLVYREEWMSQAQRVSVTLNNVSLIEALDACFRNQALTYELVNKTIVVKKTLAPLEQHADRKLAEEPQDIVITGRVTNGTGNPLEGVSIVVKGTKNGTVTDADGRFQMSVVPDANTELVFSFIGYQAKTVKVGSQTIFSIVLDQAASDLTDVVVVGYGTQRKGNLTGSVSTVKSDAITVAPAVSTTQTLAGRLPGLISKQSSGQPGSDGASLSIRGFGGALVIVDGVESGFNTIDANQIESISILKDGAASIYGARAGNGVILVTTKRGSLQKPTITLNSSYTLQGITAMPKMASAGQYAEMAREEWLQSGKPEATAPYTEEQVQKFYDGTDPQYPNTNWFKVLVRDWGPEQQHNLSVRGGTDKIKYYGFVGFTDQETMFKKNGGNYNRYNLQSNIDATVVEGLTFQLDLAAIFNKSLFGWRGMHAGANSVWQDLWNTKPVYPATLPDPTKSSYADGGGTGGAHNVIDYNASGTTRNNSQNLRGTASLTYKIPHVRGLTAKVFANYMLDYSKGAQFTKPIKFYTYDVLSDTYTLKGALGSAAQLRVNQSQGSVLTTQLSLNYDRVFASDHHLAVMALYEGIDYKSEWLSAGRDGYLSPSIEQLFAGNSGTAINDGAATEMGRSSYVGRLNYSYRNKYLLETILRADASAKFPPEKRWGYFPAVSLGWRISEEGFMQKANAVDDLKFRISYGSSGNDGVGNFQYLSGYAIDMNYLINNVVRQGIVSTGMENPNLTWEKIKIYNAGFDFSLLKRKLYGTAEVFYRTRTGIPATRITTLPSTFGASLPPENLNSINNRGFELELGTVGNVGKLMYDISGNIAWARAKWDHYEEPEYTDPDEIYINKISGEWADRRLMYKSDGLFTSQSEIDDLPFDQDLQGNTTLRPGDIRYVDLNKDGKLDWRDQVKIPGNTPLWTMGLNLNLKYKNFDFSALFQGSFGYYTHVVLAGGINSEKTYELRWTESNNDPHALVPRLGGSSLNGLTSDYRLKNSAYLRLKAASLGYNLPEQWLRSIRFQQARLYLSGINLLTFDKLKKYGVDPEMPDGMGGYYYPQQRTISFGINLSF